MTDHLIGQILKGRYRVEQFLGEGGMARVYKAWDAQRATYLAMKLLREDLSLDRVFLRRFKREAQTLSRLQHPNIVRLYGLEQEGRLAFMLLDFIEGETLKHEIFDANAPLPLDRVSDVLRATCSALHYAHQQGFVHADIKPANLMTDLSGRVLVSDFGIARMTDAATATMVGMGTPAYMAPEQVRGLDATPQTDIYALGVALYEMVTGGERPFTGEAAKITGSTSEKVRWEQVYLEPTSPRLHNHALSSEIEAVVMHCLAKEPESRYTTATELVEAFEHAFVSPAPKTGTAKKGPPLKEPKQLPRSQRSQIAERGTSTSLNRRRRRVWLVVAAVVAAALLAVLVVGTSNRDTPDETLLADRSAANSQNPFAVGHVADASDEPATLQVSQATRTPSRTPAPSPTVTPLVELSPPVQVVLSDIVVEFHDELEVTSRNRWDYYPSSSYVEFSEGQVQLIGKSYWETSLSPRRQISAGEAILVLFKYDPNSEFELYIDDGQWQATNYRRWGVYAGNFFETNIFSGASGIGFNSLGGALTLSSGTWYYLLLAVDEEADFLALVWDHDNPSRQTEYRRKFDDTWTGRSWEFQIGVNKGSVYIDSFTHLSFSGLNEPRSAEALPTAIASAEPVTINPYCSRFGESPTVVSASTPIRLVWGWIATEADLVQDHIDAVSYDVIVDGKAVEAEEMSEIFQNDDGNWVVQWSRVLERLPPGSHFVEQRVSWSRMIDDGWSTFGPGGDIEAEYDFCEIIVQAT